MKTLWAVVLISTGGQHFANFYSIKTLYSNSNEDKMALSVLVTFTNFIFVAIKFLSNPFPIFFQSQFYCINFVMRYKELRIWGRYEIIIALNIGTCLFLLVIYIAESPQFTQVYFQN